jgi:hypothetical protein
MKVKWKDIPGYENMYQVSNLGQVRSLKRTRKSKGGSTSIVRQRTLKPTLGSNGYLKVCLSHKNKRKTFCIHKLVAITFMNHEPSGHYQVIDHVNMNKLDNRLQNLRLVTMVENSSFDRGTSKYTGVCFAKDRDRWQSYWTRGGIRKTVGYFKTQEEAYNARQESLKTLQQC